MINKFSNEPLYSQLKSIILRKIDNNDYCEDTKIPSELEFCKEYGISRPTVRQAINELTNNGFLYKVRGRGTFVSRLKKNIDIKNYTGFTTSILVDQKPENRVILNTSTVDSISEIKKNISEETKSGSSYARIVYQQKNGPEMYSSNISYIPLNIFPVIIEDILAEKLPHEIFKNKYPLVPERSQSIIEMVYSEKEDTQYLQIQEGQPLLKIVNHLYSKSGKLVEIIISKYRADKCRFIFENTI